MFTSGAKLFGPIARRLLCPDRWRDDYPTTPEYAQELDALLEFMDEQGRRSRFIPRLESKAAQRDEALEELRVAYWLHHSGFPIAQWDPPGLNGMVGEYFICTPEQKNVFVEVKSPGWEGQLSDEQRKAGRAKQPKYQNGEGGAVGNWMPLQECIASENAYPKFDPVQPNLLVVSDDLVLNLLEIPKHIEVALYPSHPGYGVTGYFATPAYENLGGVGIFRAFSGGRGVEYEFRIFDNPFALPTAKLPDSILKKFKEKVTGINSKTYTGTMTRCVSF